MNKTNNITHLITQPGKCCVNCGKGYKQKKALEKHALLCDIINRSDKKRLIIEEEEEIPSNRKLYKIILELTDKYNKLEQKLEEVSKYAIKEKKKINITDWLNSNATPKYSFIQFVTNITMPAELIQSILNNSFNEILTEVFKQILSSSDEELPITSFDQKKNTLFIYTKETDNGVWQELSRELLIDFLNVIQLKISKILFDWKKINKEELRTNNTLCNTSDKALVKIMTPAFKEDTYLTKAKTLLYNHFKKDLKSMIEYEFV
uniref:Uncharacterized protein n=1 Tax=viral metagenome TaxID=1070528 RepID=A0A6C0LMY3_9ZZZZ